MKIFTIYLDGNQIEYHNNYLMSMEIIRCNGLVVSKKFSLLGAEHIFMAGDHEYRLRLTNSLAGSYVDLHRDGIAIMESNKIGCLVILATVIPVVIILDYIYRWTN